MPMTERGEAFHRKKYSRMQPPDTPDGFTRRDFLLSAGSTVAGVFVTLGFVAAGAYLKRRERRNEDTIPVFSMELSIGPKVDNSEMKKEIPVNKIADRKGYEESAMHLKEIILANVNPDYLMDHIMLLSSFEGLESLTDDELLNRITMRSLSEDSQTGFQDGVFRNTRYLIRGEKAGAILGGVIDESSETLRMSLQLDENLELIPGEVDNKTRFENTGNRLAELLNDFFKMPDYNEKIILGYGTDSISIQLRQYTDNSSYKSYEYSANQAGYLSLTLTKQVEPPPPGQRL